MTDYTQSDFAKAVKDLGIVDGDIVFSHSNIGFLGKIGGRVRPEQAIVDSFPDVTFFVPTFTYSFQNGEVYDKDNSPSKMGNLAEYVRTLPEAYRSLDPCFSVAGIGPRSYELAGGWSDNSFGDASLFRRFYANGGKILNINLNAGSTFIHYCERERGVKYRFDKEFTGIVASSIVYAEVKHSIFVRELKDIYTADFRFFDHMARKHGAYKTCRVGRGEIGVITANDTMELVEQMLLDDPLALTLGSSFLQ